MCCGEQGRDLAHTLARRLFEQHMLVGCKRDRGLRATYLRRRAQRDRVELRPVLRSRDLAKADNGDAQVSHGISSDSCRAALASSLILAYVIGICQRNKSMSEQRHVRLFRNGRNQAVRIPVEFELPGSEAIMHRDGDRLVIEPVRKRGLVALLKTMKPVEDRFPEIDDPPPAAERAL